MIGSKSCFVGFLILANLAATPSLAACWGTQALSAAKVREFETMLMVSALRCRSGQENFLARYNQFVREARPALARANITLRGQFVADHGARGGLLAYDAFVTSLANRYGATGPSCLEASKMVNAALAARGNIAQLERLASASPNRAIFRQQCADQITVRR